MKNEVLIEVSARHVHLSQEHIDILFGEGYSLTPDKWLSQPGQFLSKERIKIVGAKKNFENAGILGPARKASQVELSLTDCYSIGIIAPVRESGNIAGTPGLELSTEKGKVTLTEGLIVAQRHIHMTPKDALELGLNDKEIVSVKVNTSRGLTFENVVVRVRSDFALYMHIDTDEANAAGIGKEQVFGQIIKK